jgi:transcriptional regulator with XRE-family HTH domain
VAFSITNGYHEQTFRQGDFCVEANIDSKIDAADAPDDELPEQILFGKVVEAFRVKRGLNQSDLAERAGISNAALSRLERGESNPTLGTILALARGLRVAPHELIRAFDASRVVANRQVASVAQALGLTVSALLAAHKAATGGPAGSAGVGGEAKPTAKPGEVLSGMLGVALGAIVAGVAAAALANYLSEDDQPAPSDSGRKRSPKGAR